MTNVDNYGQARVPILSLSNCIAYKFTGDSIVIFAHPFNTNRLSLPSSCALPLKGTVRNYSTKRSIQTSSIWIVQAKIDFISEYRASSCTKVNFIVVVKSVGGALDLADDSLGSMQCE